MARGPMPAGLAALAAVGTVAAGALGYAVLGGAGRGQEPPALQLLVLVDKSGSESKTTRHRRFGALDDVIETTLPVQNRVTIWSYGPTIQKEWGPGRVVKSRDLWPVEDDISAGAVSQPGTHLGAALQAAAQAARQASAKGEPVACLVLGSGEETDHAVAADAARELAALPNVRAVWFAGAKSEAGLRTSVEQTLSPIGSRLVVSGPFDARSGLESFRRLVKGQGDAGT